jgi:hypothetical protein
VETGATGTGVVSGFFREDVAKDGTTEDGCDGTGKGEEEEGNVIDTDKVVVEDGVEEGEEEEEDVTMNRGSATTVDGGSDGDGGNGGRNSN